MQQLATLPSAPPPPPLPTLDTEPIAPWLHTLLFAAILVGTTWFGQARASAAPAGDGSHHLARYLLSALLEWVLLLLVLAGIRRRRVFLQHALLSRATPLVQSLGMGVAVYACGFVAIALVSLILLQTPLGAHRNQAYVLAMLPRTASEFVAWFFLSFTAGFCEELMFRGYLLQQFLRWTRRPALSVFLVSLLFGCVHLYEGVGSILPLMALALVYGFVVLYLRGDLRAVIVAHTLQDFLVGLLGLARPWLERMQHLH